MFHWICPECGREIPPSVRECPACDPRSAPVVQADPVPQLAVTASVKQFEVAAPSPLLAAEVAQSPVKPVVQPAPPVVPEPSPEPEPLPDPLLAIAEQVRAAQAARAAAMAPVEPQAPPLLPEPADQPKGLLELAGAVGMSNPPAPGMAAEVPELPLTDADLSEPEPAAPEQAHAAPEPAPVQPQIHSHSEDTVHPIVALAELASVASFTPRPAIGKVRDIDRTSVTPECSGLKAGPQTPQTHVSGPTLGLAPLQSFTAAAGRAMRPVPPKNLIMRPEPGPRITLPGPTLPPELARLQDASIVTVIGGSGQKPPAQAKQGGGQSWMVTFLTMTIVLGVLLGGVFYMMPHSNADTKAAPAAAQTPAAPHDGSHSLASFVEVTGFRIVGDPAKKAEVHYLAVNHSTAELADVTVFVTLRNAYAAAGQPPICKFSFRAAGLAPNESKEMVSPIEKVARAVTLPEWQDLRAEVQISQ
jgi:hypothetical protein